MVAFPNAKINLGLNVISKRADGYHNISSCFYPIGWCDVLEIIPADKFKFSTSGLPIEGSKENNLCVKAFRLLEQDFNLKPVHIHLHKVIPLGAGLGGGSSDGAFTLKLLNELFQLNISIEKLKSYAAVLGSDCTFFINNKPSLVSGVGEKLEIIDFSLKEYQMMVIYPDIHVPTSMAYQGINPETPEMSVQEILSSDIGSLKENLNNDFEFPVGKVNSKILEIKEKLYQGGAIYASMSGSGSAVYGIFNKNQDLNQMKTQFDSLLIWMEQF